MKNIVMKNVDWKQQELLEDFFKEESSWCPEHVGYRLVAFIMIGISMILLVCPYQVWTYPDEMPVLTMIYVMELQGIMFYGQKYVCYKGEKGTERIYDILKYMPIGHWQLCIFRIRKSIKLCAWITGILIACQCIFAISLLHTFSVGNILIPIAGTFIIPLFLIICDFQQEISRQK